MDTFDQKRRSEIMALIRSDNTKPELAVRQMLHKLGFRFRLRRKDLPGKPDIVLPRFRTVVFVHGCFWHGHDDCREGRRPKSNTCYWNAKLDRNRERDMSNQRLLLEQGWHSIIVWECELRKPEILTQRLMLEIRRPDECTS